MLTEEMKRLLDIYVRLSAERDRESLLTHIVDTAIDIASCDSGALYLLEDGELHFSRLVIRSLGIHQGGNADPVKLPPVELDLSSTCDVRIPGSSLINLSHSLAGKWADSSAIVRYDAMLGYTTRSMVIYPLSDDQGRLIGLLQLSNALSPEGEVIPFEEKTEPLIRALASQASISLTNMQYSERVRGLLDSLVGSLSLTIDQRIPFNANHTRNMVRYATAFLDWLDRNNHKWKFSSDDRRAFLMSVWLHDVGKLAVPLELMVKESRLSGALTVVEQRFSIIGLRGRVGLLEGRISEEDARSLDAQLKAGLELIRRVNCAAVLTDDDLESIRALASHTYLDEDGVPHPWLTAEEQEALSIRKGTLTDRERELIQDHVSITARILERVSFPEEYAKVPEWAASHHELLNGTGYPHHRTAETLPREVRLLTILDVFEALTANDRPYKSPVPVEDALSTLHSMVRAGELDGDILDLFEQSRAWEIK